MAQIIIKGVIGKDYTYKQFITDFANARGEQIDLFIDSAGGDVDDGELIQKFIQSKAEQFNSVRNSGAVASIAASIFLALPYEKRFFDMSKGIALIHNPFIGDTNGMDTTANGLKSASDYMLECQNSISKHIVKQTNADSAVIDALMSVNEPLSEAQMVAINFAQIIKFQAVAFYNNNNQNQMKEEEVVKLLEKNNESFLSKIKAMFQPKPKALMVTIADGSMINFPDVADGIDPQVGDKASLESGGAIPDGDVVMADGEVYTFVGGVVTKITEVAPEPMDEPLDEVAALKAEIESLKAAQNKVVFDLKAQIKSQMITIDEKEKIEKGNEQPENRLSSDLKSKFKNK
jgi:ATP-dependent protease ClpP protease subunit